MGLGIYQCYQETGKFDTTHKHTSHEPHSQTLMSISAFHHLQQLRHGMGSWRENTRLPNTHVIQCFTISRFIESARESLQYTMCSWEV